MGKIISRACPFRPQEIADLQDDPGLTFEQGDRVNDWHKENCRCVKEGFNDFYCPHWQYSPEEQQNIKDTLALAAEQAQRRASQV